MDVNKIKYDSSLDNEELIVQAKSGDIEAKNLLFKNNIPFVRRLARRWQRGGSGEEYEELLSLGFLGMTRAYNAYDPAKGYNFIFLVSKVVWNLYQNHEKSHPRRGSNV